MSETVTNIEAEVIEVVLRNPGLTEASLRSAMRHEFGAAGTLAVTDLLTRGLITRRGCKVYIVDGDVA